MGIESLLIGKGVIIPTRLFINTFRTELETTTNFNKNSDEYDIYELISKIMKKHDFYVSYVGHDAFTARHDMINVFNDKDHANALQFIREWQINNPNDKDSKGNPFNFGGYIPELIFIGCYKELNTTGEFGGRIKTAELLYALGSLIPAIMKYNEKLKDKDCSILTNLFGQQPCMWIFAADCHCCG